MMNAPFQSQMDYKPKQSYFPVMIGVAIVAVFGLLGYAAVTDSFSFGDSGKNAATKSVAQAPELPTAATSNATTDNHGATANNDVPATVTPSSTTTAPAASADSAASTPHAPALANAAPADAPSAAKAPLAQANVQGGKKHDKGVEASMKTPATLASAKPGPAQSETASKESGNGATSIASLCSDCGVVESVRRVDSVQKDGSESADANGSGDANASSYRIQVHMEDGKVRIVYQRDAPTVAIGDHVKIVDGAVVQQS